MKTLTVLVIAVLLAGNSLHAQERYIDEIFTDVVKVENQIYGVNFTVITGAPTLDTLRFDLYMPAGDTITARPLAVVLHNGSFLPRGYVAPTGDKDDYGNVQVCERLAKRGYVAASIQYRLGWNPLAPDDFIRRLTIINAAYRAVQDLHAFLRYMNMTVDSQCNPYMVCMDRVALFGLGTGALVAFNSAVLNSVEETYITKYTNPLDGTRFIDTNLVGDIHGINPAAINIPNHVGYKDEFHFAFGIDGLIGDCSFMENGTCVPMAAAGVVSHPTTPYGIDPLTGEISCELPVYSPVGFVVNVCGSVCIISKANALGINAPLNVTTYDDPVSTAIRNNPKTLGEEHLWGINLPGPQTGPWEYWDSDFWSQVPCPFGPNIDDCAKATNPDMSMEKANAYIDTALWFFAPRAYAVLNLGEVSCPPDPACDGIEMDSLIVYDFECQRNYDFSTGSDRLCTVNNPQVDADNSSTKVGVYRDPANDPWAALCIDFGKAIDFAASDQFELQINAPVAAPVLLKLEGGSSPPYETSLNVTTPGIWETLNADFSSQYTANHTRLCIFPNAGVGQETEDLYYIDNLKGLRTVGGIFSPTVDALDISPNPVHHVLYIRNPGKAGSFRLFNTLGQQVMEAEAHGQEMVSMTMGDLHQGLYLLGAYDDKGKLFANARILKN